LQSGIPGGHVAKPKGNRQCVKHSIAERQLKAVRLHEQRDPLSPRNFQHGQAEVSPDNNGPRRSLAKRPGQVAASCRQIKNMPGIASRDDASRLRAP
jgi:hypothetical protein